jgi:hypothetical protein
MLAALWACFSPKFSSLSPKKESSGGYKKIWTNDYCAYFSHLLHLLPKSSGLESLSLLIPCYSNFIASFLEKSSILLWSSANLSRIPTISDYFSSSTAFNNFPNSFKPEPIIGK